MNTKKRGIRSLIVVGVIIVLALGAYILVSSVDIAELLRRIHGG